MACLFASFAPLREVLPSTSRKGAKDAKKRNPAKVLKDVYRSEDCKLQIANCKLQIGHESQPVPSRSLRIAVPSLAILADFSEEQWPSMDLVAEMLFEELRANHAGAVNPALVCPPFRRWLGRLPALGRTHWAFNADRLLNRLCNYPRYLRRTVKGFDLFHICDHSYAHLAHRLPAERTGVYCHDLDAFGCLLENHSTRPQWYKAIARRTLSGLQKAAVVFHSTASVRRQIEKYGLVDPSRLVHAPYGVSPEFTAEPVDATAAAILAPGLGQAPFLLHVGSCIPRKRVDALLDVFAVVRLRHPELRLVQIGGRWTAAQQEQIERLKIAPAVLQLRGIDRTTLAALYQRAALVLMPSAAEGFGIPVIEALACGSLVVASDLPVLREVGGQVCVYCTVADVPQWVETVCQLLDNPQTALDRPARSAWASRFTWQAHARTILKAYEGLL